MKNKKKFIIWTLAISIVLVVVLIYSNVTKVKPLTYTYSPYKATSEVTGNYAKYLEDVEKYIANLDVNKDEDTTNDFKLNAELKTYFIDGTSYKEGSEIDVTTIKQELDEDGEYVDVEVKSKSTVSMGADTIAFSVDKATGVAAGNAEFKTTESYANADGRHETQNLLLVNDRGQIIYETPEELVAGFYNIYIKYYSTSYKSTRSAVERTLKVVTPNGNINQSFDANLGAQSYVFSRNWGNDEFATQTKLESNSDSFMHRSHSTLPFELALPATNIMMSCSRANLESLSCLVATCEQIVSWTSRSSVPFIISFSLKHSVVYSEGLLVV